MSEQKAVPPRSHFAFLGSLKDALAAAGREDAVAVQPGADGGRVAPELTGPPPALPAPSQAYASAASDDSHKTPLPPAADAVRDARAGAPNVPPLGRAEVGIVTDEEASPTTRIARRSPARGEAAADRTQVLRGKPKVARGEFEQDPVVGWLVVVGGPGLGAFRPIFEGNNTVGRSSSQRVPVDFGDDAISSEEQAYIRYDSAERSFLFVPNLAKTNIVSVNGKRPTAAVPMTAMDVIQMGRTQLVFVPFCGADFDWSELADKAAAS